MHAFVIFLLVPKYHATKLKGVRSYQDIVNEDSVPSRLSLAIFDQRVNIKMSRDHSFIADSHVTEYVGDNGTYYRDYGDIGIHISGRINGDNHSHVALLQRDDGMVKCFY